MLEASNCQLTSLDLGPNTSMEKLSLMTNKLHTLNLGKTTLLNNIDIRINPLKLVVMGKNRSIKVMTASSTVDKLEIDE